MSGPAPHVIYEFGTPARCRPRLLFARGASDALPIKPKVLEAILYFVEHPGELLEKDSSWPSLAGARVEENPSSRSWFPLCAVSSARAAARTGTRYGAGPRLSFVATSCAPVGATEARPAAPSIAPEPSRSATTPSRRMALLAAVALAVSLCAAVYAYGLYAGWWPAPTSDSTAVAPSCRHAPSPFWPSRISARTSNEHLASGLAESVLQPASPHSWADADRSDIFVRISRQDHDAGKSAAHLTARYLAREASSGGRATARNRAAHRREHGRPRLGL